MSTGILINQLIIKPIDVIIDTSSSTSDHIIQENLIMETLFYISFRGICLVSVIFLFLVLAFIRVLILSPLRQDSPFFQVYIFLVSITTFTSSRLTSTQRRVLSQWLEKRRNGWKFQPMATLSFMLLAL